MLLATRDVEVVVVSIEAPTSLVYHSKKLRRTIFFVDIPDILNL